VYNNYTVSILFLRKFSVKLNPIFNLKILKINPLKTSVLFRLATDKGTKANFGAKQIKTEKNERLQKIFRQRQIQ
jgi:transposase